MMETSVTNGMCRCCASEGAFKDVKSSYHWMGQEEVYGDMLRECFDLSLSISEGEQGSICELCITQLRNAVNFKKQVLHTEEQFKTRLQNKLFKTSIVKVELSGDDDNDSGDNNMSGDDDYSGPDFEVPIKTESPDEPKSKKRAVKATTSSTKRTKTNVGETSTKRIGCITSKIIKIEPKVSNRIKAQKSNMLKKTGNDLSVTVNKKQSISKTIKEIMSIEPLIMKKKEIYKHLHNIRTILLHSNATPIRCHNGLGYSCGFCIERFAAPADLKRHSLEKHDDSAKNTFMKGRSLNEYVVKLDITSLRCELCENDIAGLNQFVEHLKIEHKKTMYTDINNHILPFKFENDDFSCVICCKKFECFKLIQEHMSMHYRNFVCNTCNASFISKRHLKNHSNRHKKGEFNCSFCSKVFDTQIKKDYHEKFVHTGDYRRNKCPHCPEKFTRYAKRLDHMVKEHGAQPVVLKCKACDATFKNRESLTRHTKRDHLLERRHECSHCDMKFYARKDMLHHMIKHTGVRQYRCEFCLKAFGRKHTLREHLRIHADDRRFKCEHCGQAFVQKCSWKSHMRSKHGEMV